MIATADLHWLAGLVEGEGCFTHEGGLKGTRPMFVLNMTDLDVVQRAQAVTGLGRIYEMSYPDPRKRQWRWKVHRQAEAAGLAMTLYPLLGARRQAKIRDIMAVWTEK